MEQQSTGSVISADGTKIGYRQSGSGPGLILVHGGMMSSQNFEKLAGFLADDFTVYVPDRQGRGLSELHRHHSLSIEAEAIQALVEKTKASFIFGLSSGAIITLQAAITFPGIQKIALFEPPIPISSGQRDKWYSDYERGISTGNSGKAFMSIIKGTGDPSVFKSLPTFITAPLLNMAIKAQHKSLKENEIPLQLLVQLFKYDYTIMQQSVNLPEQSKHLHSEVLLLGGTKSQRFLKEALDRLALALPNAKRVTFSAIGHLAADNSGKPGLVADELRKFFKTPDLENY